MAKTVMFGEVSLLDVIEATAPQGLQREGEAGRVDNMDPNPEAGAKAERSARILGKIRLVEGKFECDLGLPVERCRMWRWV